MATTDNARIVQRPLAEHAWDLRKKYNLNRNMSKKAFMDWYDLGEIQLSTVYENLFVSTRQLLGKPTVKESADRYDFIDIISPGHKKILGDMKTSVLRKNGDKRRFVIPAVDQKIGNIYAVCWNWMTNKVCYFAIPPDEHGNHPKCGYKIMVCPNTGRKTGGWYNENCYYDSWEEMVSVD